MRHLGVPTGGSRGPRHWLRDPLLTLANTPLALLVTLIGSWLVASAAFSALEDVTLTDALYWSITTMTSTGYGDVTPKTDAGKVLAGVYMSWSLFFLLPAAIFHMGERILHDRHQFDHEEQELVKARLERIERAVCGDPPPSPPPSQ